MKRDAHPLRRLALAHLLRAQRVMERLKASGYDEWTCAEDCLRDQLPDCIAVLEWEPDEEERRQQEGLDEPPPPRLRLVN